MKIFDIAGNWSNKVNFVDENNVLVGYDMSSHCCEHADWFISETEDDNVIDGNGITEELDIYNFDATYFSEVKTEDCDCGRMVRFKLVAKDKYDLFLHLYNVQNGYYSHGFEFKINDIIFKEGSL